MGPTFVCCLQRLSSSGYVFSASLPPYLASAAIAAVDHLETNPSILSNLRANIATIFNGTFLLLLSLLFSFSFMAYLKNYSHGFQLWSNFFFKFQLKSEFVDWLFNYNVFIWKCRVVRCTGACCSKPCTISYCFSQAEEINRFWQDWYAPPWVNC